MSAEQQLLQRIINLERQAERNQTWESISCGSQAALFRRPYATKVIAASNSLASSKDQADFVCTGTNDQEAIHAALGQAPTGRIVLLDGDYRFGAPCDLRSHYEFELVGMGKSTRIHYQAQANPPGSFSFSAEPSGPDFPLIRFLEHSYNVVVRDIFFDGEDPAFGTSGYLSEGSALLGGQGVTVQGLVLENLWIENMPGSGVWFYDLRSAVLNNVNVGLSQAHGIHLSQSFNNIVQGGKLYQNGLLGLFVGESRGSDYRQIHAYNNGLHGIWIEYFNPPQAT